ncbi:hypothetical protein L1987_88595 [Smallanthus sonchifolius]|nr:hypothetical protein L1987_88595 [Smallanthus sonchifolius]
MIIRSPEPEVKILVDRDHIKTSFEEWARPGHFSRTIAKGPETTTWIWNLHADAHDFDSHTSDLEEISRKVFSAHFGQLSIIFLWLSGMYFHGARFSNYEAWLSDPTHIGPSAQVVWPIVGQEILNGDVGGGFRGIQITSGFFQIWRASGITSELQLYCTAIGALIFAALMLFAGWFHYHKAAPKLAWFQDVESMLNHHLAGLLGLGSLSWAGHQVHVSLPINQFLNAGVDPKEIPLPHEFILNRDLLAQLYPSFAEGATPFFTLNWSKYADFLTFRGGLDPVTGGLWLTDTAHHHLAIAILFLIAGHMYRTNWGIAHHMYAMPPYPYLATDYGTQLSLFTHHMWIGGFLIVGAAAHAAIFMGVLKICFQIPLSNYNPSLLNGLQNTHALAPGATAPGATASTSLTWGGGDLVAVGGKVALLPIPLGTADFLSDVWGSISDQGVVTHITGGNFAQSSITINGWLRDFLWAQASQEDLKGIMALRFPRFSQGLAQDPTTRRIWFGIATAHDFESHDDITEERLYQNIFASHFGQLAIIFLWTSGNLFHVAWQGNFESWVKDPLHVRPIAHAIWDPHFGQPAVEAFTRGGAPGPVNIAYSGVYQWWYTIGLRTNVDLYNGALFLLFISAISLIAGQWNLYAQNPDSSSHLFGTSQGAGTAILTLLGGFHPQTQSLWLTDMAHHHLAIAFIFLIAGHMYRTNFGIGHSMKDLLDAHIPPGGRLGRGHKGLYDTINNSIHFQLGLALASLGVITSLKQILIEPIFAQWIQSAHGKTSYGFDILLSSTNGPAFNAGRSIWLPGWLNAVNENSNSLFLTIGPGDFLVHHAIALGLHTTTYGRGAHSILACILVFSSSLRRGVEQFGSSQGS